MNSIKLIQDQAGAYYMLYRIERDTGNLRKAIEWLLILHEKNNIVRKSGSKLSTEILLNDNNIIHSIADIYPIACTI